MGSLVVNYLTNPPAYDNIPRMQTRQKTTVAYYIAFISLGLVAAALGPTLPGLAAQTGSQINQISFLFTARSLGFLLGAFAVGHLYDRLPGHKLMTAALLLMGLLLFLTPLMPILAALTAVIFFLGVVESGIDVGANTLIVWLHGRAVGPYVNGLHFFFGVGALLSPLIIAQAVLRGGGIQWAYWVLALLMVPAAVYLFRLPSPQTRPRTEQDSSGQAAWLLVLLIAVFFFLYAGAEISFGGWIFSYAVAMEVADEVTAAYLTSAFWAAFTVGRLISIPLAARFRARALMTVDLLGCLTSLGMMMVWPQSVTAVWLGTMGLGLSFASLFPTTLILAERHLHVQGKTTSYFFMGASLGAMTIPWFIGQRFEAVGPQATLTIIMACLLGATAVFAILMRQITIRERGNHG